MTTLTAPKKLLTQRVYQRIERDLRDRIDSGAWVVGAPLPSRAALAREYGVGLATLERAVSALLADGTLSAVPGQHTVIGKVSRDGGVADRRASVGAFGGTPSLLDVKPQVLGIISYEPLREDEPKGSIDGWLYETALRIERSYLHDGGVTLFRALKPNNGSAPVIEDLLYELRDAGANEIVVVDLSAALGHSDIEVLSRVHSSGEMLVVHISDCEVDVPIPHVYYDSPYLGRQAVKHLANRGFEKFAYVSPLRLPWSLDRCAQARSMADALGFGADAVTPIFGSDDRPPTGEEHDNQQVAASLAFGRKLFSQPDYPRCIIAANDFTAFGLIEASHEMGLIQGVDYAIVGFDDEVKALRYGLTTFRPPLEEIGTEAAVLLNRVSRGESCSMQIRLRSRLIARASTMSANDLASSK